MDIAQTAGAPHAGGAAAQRQRLLRPGPRLASGSPDAGLGRVGLILLKCVLRRQRRSGVCGLSDPTTVGDFGAGGQLRWPHPLLGGPVTSETPPIPPTIPAATDGHRSQCPGTHARCAAGTATSGVTRMNRRQRQRVRNTGRPPQPRRLGDPEQHLVRWRQRQRQRSPPPLVQSPAERRKSAATPGPGDSTRGGGGGKEINKVPLYPPILLKSPPFVGPVPPPGRGQGVGSVSLWRRLLASRL